MTLPDKPFLTPPQAAEFLGVSPDNVLRWIATGELRASDLSTIRGQRPRWKISRVDLEVFLHRRAKAVEPKRRGRRRGDDGVTEFY
jgi:excisionase family DNA binding protein